MSADVHHLAPMTDALLRLALRGLGLPASPRVADLCCGMGAASRLLVKEFDATCTGVDMSDTLVRRAREAALEEGLHERMEFVHADARHVELPTRGFDLVLALGGALTYVGRSEGLERIRLLLKPGGAILLTDLVYLDSAPPEEVVRMLSDQAPESEIRPLALEPAVRAVFEEGVFRFETEQTYNELLALHGYDRIFAFHVPESAWNAYYAYAAGTQLDPSAPIRVPVGADELASYYCWGGRWGVAYLVVGARIAEETAEVDPS